MRECSSLSHSFHTHSLSSFLSFVCVFRVLTIFLCPFASCAVVQQWHEQLFFSSSSLSLLSPFAYVKGICFALPFRFRSFLLLLGLDFIGLYRCRSSIVNVKKNMSGKEGQLAIIYYSMQGCCVCTLCAVCVWTWGCVLSIPFYFLFPLVVLLQQAMFILRMSVLYLFCILRVNVYGCLMCLIVCVACFARCVGVGVDYIVLTGHRI